MIYTPEMRWWKAETHIFLYEHKVGSPVGVTVLEGYGFQGKESRLAYHPCRVSQIFRECLLACSLSDTGTPRGWRRAHKALCSTHSGQSW